MLRRPPTSTRTDPSFPTRLSSDLQHRIAIGPDQEIEQRLALRGQQRRPARCIGIEGGDVAGDEALEESAHILAGKADQRAIGETGSHTPQVGAHRLEPKGQARSEEHTSELQSLMRNAYAVFCLKKKIKTKKK